MISHPKMDKRTHRPLLSNTTTQGQRHQGLAETSRCLRFAFRCSKIHSIYTFQLWESASFPILIVLSYSSCVHPEFRTSSFKMVPTLINHPKSGSPIFSEPKRWGPGLMPKSWRSQTSPRWAKFREYYHQHWMLDYHQLCHSNELFLIIKHFCMFLQESLSKIDHCCFKHSEKQDEAHEPECRHVPNFDKA